VIYVPRIHWVTRVSLILFFFFNLGTEETLGLFRRLNLLSLGHPVTRSRCNLVDLNFVTHRPQNATTGTPPNHEPVKATVLTAILK
jgi:hypothetical protein